MKKSQNNKKPSTINKSTEAKKQVAHKLSDILLPEDKASAEDTEISLQQSYRVSDLLSHSPNLETEIDSIALDPVLIDPEKGKSLVSESGDKEHSSSESFNQATLKKRLDEMESNLKAEIAKEIRKALAEQRDGRVGKELKEDYPDSDTNVPLKLNIPSSTLKKLNRKVNALRKAGLIKSRDMYINNLLQKDL